MAKAGLRQLDGNAIWDLSGASTQPSITCNVYEGEIFILIDAQLLANFFPCFLMSGLFLAVLLKTLYLFRLPAQENDQLANLKLYQTGPKPPLEYRHIVLDLA